VGERTDWAVPSGAELEVYLYTLSEGFKACAGLLHSGGDGWG
jgi:hypothetical protein